MRDPAKESLLAEHRILPISCQSFEFSSYNKRKGIRKRNHWGWGIGIIEARTVEAYLARWSVRLAFLSWRLWILFVACFEGFEFSLLSVGFFVWILFLYIGKKQNSVRKKQNSVRRASRAIAFDFLRSLLIFLFFWGPSVSALSLSQARQFSFSLN